MFPEGWISLREATPTTVEGLLQEVFDTLFNLQVAKVR